MTFWKLLFLLGPAMVWSHAAQAQPEVPSQSLRLNEILSSNSQGLRDADGDASDWLEIYNGTDSAINLAGYGLTDDPNQPFRWVFPAITLDTGAFLLVWASGKDRLIGELHTNFSLSASGEPLQLRRPNGQLVDSLPAMALRPDVSYGRWIDGDTLLFYFSQPTPEASNNTAARYQRLLQPLQFSHGTGFYPQPFQLSISSPDTGIQILYTLDGSEPDPAQLGGSSFLYKQRFPMNPGDPVGDSLFAELHTQLYQQPLLIGNASSDTNRWSMIAATYDYNTNHFPDLPIQKSRVVRAKAYHPNGLTAGDQTATFFVDSLGRARYDLPIVSLVTDPRHLHDYQQGLWTPGVDFDSWRASRPNYPVDPGMAANYHRRGDAWEYPLWFQYFETGQNQPILEQKAGFRNHGEWGRALPRKAIRLHARSEYGASHFNHALFPQEPYSQFKRLLFRNSDWGATNFRDDFLQSLVSNLSFETQAYRPVVMFVNGEYWGLGSQRERYDAHYFARKYQVPEGQIDLLVAQYGVEEGDSLDYIDLLDYIAQNPLSDSAAYAQVNTRMDVENFTDYWISNTFLGNDDWPYKNIRYWRKRVPYTPGAGQHDGRWRWLMFDLDWSFDLSFPFDRVFLNTSTQAEGSDRPDWTTFLVRSLLENDDYRDHFVRRYLDLLNTNFKSERVIAQLDSFENLLAPFVPEHLQRWKSVTWGMVQWHDQVQAMRNMAAIWPDSNFVQLGRRFDLEQPLWVQLSNAQPEMGAVRFNTLLLDESQLPTDSSRWEGRYYRELPLLIEALPGPGFAFVRWEGLPDSLSPQQSLLWTTDSLHIRAVFRIDSLDQPETVLEWHFNQLPSGTLTSVASDQSSGAPGRLSYPGSGAGYLDRVNDGSLINAAANQTAGYALRVRNPANTRQLLLELPPLAYRDLQLSYAVSRTNNGATLQRLWYQSDTSAAWQDLPFQPVVTEQYSLVEADLSVLQQPSHPGGWRLRIDFEGPAAANASGNNRFDNLRIAGKPARNEAELLHYWHFNAQGSAALAAVQADSSYAGGAHFAATSAAPLPAQGSGAPYHNLYLQPGGKSLQLAPDEQYDLQFYSLGQRLSELRYVLRDSSNAAPWHRWWYLDVATGQWALLCDSIATRPDFTLYHWPLDQLNSLHNRDTARLRLEFFGGSGPASAVVKFDNLMLLGRTAIFTYDTLQLCDSSFVLWRGDSLLQSGWYEQWVPVAGAADSVFGLNLRLSQSNQRQQQVHLCEGASWTSPKGNVWQVAGQYIDTLVNAAGCDSIIFTELLVDTIIPWQINAAVCRGDSLQLPDGSWVADAGQYFGTLPGGTSCDTVWTVDLTLLERPALPLIQRSLDTLWGPTASGYQWYLDGQALAGAQGSFWVVNANGWYALAIADSNGCWSDTASVLVTNSALVPVEIFQLELFPNPTQGRLHLRWEQTTPTPLTLQIFDAFGRMLWEEKLAGDSQQHQLQLPAWPSGMYWLRLRSVTGQAHRRFFLF